MQSWQPKISSPGLTDDALRGVLKRWEAREALQTPAAGRRNCTTIITETDSSVNGSSSNVCPLTQSIVCSEQGGCGVRVCCMHVIVLHGSPAQIDHLPQPIIPSKGKARFIDAREIAQILL